MYIHLGKYKNGVVQYDTKYQHIFYPESSTGSCIKCKSVSVPMPKDGCIGDEDDPIINWCEKNLEDFEEQSHAEYDPDVDY